MNLHFRPQGPASLDDRRSKQNWHLRGDLQVTGPLRVLITEDWKIWRIDFTRAFRLYKSLENPKDLVMCDRNLLENLRKLDEQEVLEKTKGQLSKSEVKAMMARRDKIVEYFEKLVAQKGEAAVLY
jgi:hypothetical protein